MLPLFLEGAGGGGLECLLCFFLGGGGACFFLGGAGGFFFLGGGGTAFFEPPTGGSGAALAPPGPALILAAE